MKFNLKPFELNVIRILAETRSISISADKTKISQANLSRMLTSLEDKIGAKIFDRGTRPLTLTRFGNELLPYIISSLEKNQEITNFIDNYNQEPKGSISIHASTTLIYLLSQYTIAQISQKYPDIKVELKTINAYFNDYSKGITFPEDGDLLLSTVPPRDTNLIAKKITLLKCGIYSSQAFKDSHPTSTILDFESRPCIQYGFKRPNGNIWNFRYKKDNKPVSIITHGHYLCDNVFIALSMAKEGLGYIYTPDFAISLFGFKQDLVLSTPDDVESHIPVYMIYRKKGLLSYRVQLMLDSIVEILRKLLSERIV